MWSSSAAASSGPPPRPSWRRPARAVTLVEGEGLASGASGANSGVVQHPFDPVLAGLYRETVELYRELSAADLGFRLPDEPAGLLYLSADEAAVRERRSLAGRGVSGARPVGRQRRRARAARAGRRRRAVGVPGRDRLPGLPGRLDLRLRDARRAARAPRSGSGGPPRWTSAATRSSASSSMDGRLACDAVLVAAGPWSPGLVDPSGRWTPDPPSVGRRRRGGARRRPVARPRGGRDRGLDRRAGRSARRRRATDRRSRARRPRRGARGLQLRPARRGRVGRFDVPARQPDPAAWIEPILRNAATFVPGIADAPIRGTRACARPQSADGRPLIGQVPGRRRLFICAGHGAWGISTGPASARLVVDQMLGARAGHPGRPGSGAVRRDRLSPTAPRCRLAWHHRR